MIGADTFVELCPVCSGQAFVSANMPINARGELRARWVCDACGHTWQDSSGFR